MTENFWKLLENGVQEVAFFFEAEVASFARAVVG